MHKILRPLSVLVICFEMFAGTMAYESEIESSRIPKSVSIKSNSLIQSNSTSDNPDLTSRNPNASQFPPSISSNVLSDRESGEIDLSVNNSDSPNVIPVDFNDISETEPNDNCATANTLTLGDRIYCGHLDLDAGDPADFFQFTLDDSYELWTVACSTSAPNYLTECDPPIGINKLYLYDSDCYTVLGYDDNIDSVMFGKVHTVIRTDLSPGIYKIKVMPIASNRSGYYHLDFTAGAYQPPGNPISETEPNNTYLNANLMSCGDYVHCANVTANSDTADYFKFTLDNTYDYWAVTCYTTAPTPADCSPVLADTRLWLYNSDCSTLIQFDDEGGNDHYSLISQLHLEPGTYVIKANQYRPTALSGHYDMVLTCEEGIPYGLLNDECENAEVITGPYPVTVSGTNIEATIDCPGYLDWDAIWYKIELPYAFNNLTIDWTPTCEIDGYFNEIGAIYMPDCSCNSHVNLNCRWQSCPEPYDPVISFPVMSSAAPIAGPAMIYYPVNPDRQTIFRFIVDVTEAASCDLECPPDGIPEGEPDCGPNYVDNYNGGCESYPNVFQSVEAGDIICGTSGTYMVGDTLYRDTDWYELTTTDHRVIQIKAIADFPLELYILDAVCPTPTILASAVGQPCDSLRIYYNAPAGTYRFVVCPSLLPGYDCTKNYVAWFYTTELASPIPITAPGTWVGDNTCDGVSNCNLLDYNGPDVPYEVTIPFDGQWTFTLCNSPVVWDSYIALGSTLCSIDIAHGDQDACGDAWGHDKFTAELYAGIYYLTVFSGLVNDCGPYQLDITGEPFWPNDECTGVTPGELIPGGALTFTGNNTGAASINDCTESSIGRFPNVWEAFTTSDWLDVTIDYCGTTPAYSTVQLELAVDCPCNDYVSPTEYDNTTCGDGNSTIKYSTLPPGTYYIPVAWTPDSEGPYTIHVNADSATMPEISVYPTEIIEGADSGQSVSANLMVSNSGGADLVANASIFINEIQDLRANLKLSHVQNFDPLSKVNGLEYDALHCEINTPPGLFEVLQGGENISSAMSIISLPFSDNGTTEGYLDDYDVAYPFTSSSPDVVYSFVPDENTLLDISLCRNSTYDTKLYVFKNSPDTVVAVNDDAFNSLSMVSNVPVATGNTYYIVVDGSRDQSGTYTIDVAYGNPPPACDDDALFSQNPSIQNDFWTFMASDIQTSYAIADNFSLVFGNINQIKWYGVDLGNSGGGWQECDFDEPSLFQISFCNDADGFPGDTVASYLVQTTGVPTGQIFFGEVPYEQKEWVADISPAVALNEGWVIIQGMGNNACKFLWQNSGSDDAMRYYSDDNFWAVTDCGIAFCLLGDYIEPWLTIGDSNIEMNISIPANGPNINIPLSLNATNLAAGLYHGGVHFVTNDAAHPEFDIPVTFDVVRVGIDNEPAELPSVFSLSQNYPNPFNATTSINFSLKNNGEVTLTIYDILGKRVNTLYNGALPAGQHSLIWNGIDDSGKVVTSGIYFYRLESDEGSIIKKMVMLK